MDINILGTKYSLCFGTEKEYPKLKDKDGLCDTSSKKIFVREFDEKLKDDPDVKEDLQAYKRQVVRHEIVHAMFHESGLSDMSNYENDELLVDWLAIQSPKLLAVFEEATAL